MYDKRTAEFKHNTLYTIYFYYKSQDKYKSLKKTTKFEYSKICTEFNRLLIDTILTSGKAYKLPFIGTLYINRRRLKHNKYKDYKYKYNYAETRKEGIPVQFDTAHSSHFIYHLRWKRDKVKHYTLYYLKTVREVGVKIKKAVMDKTIKFYI